MATYYNEIEPTAAKWLRSLIKRGLIAPGDVDERDIRDVTPAELIGYDQHHFFAGIGGWSYALRLAGWSDDRPVWTGSCPCPPFSTAGRRKACPECGGQDPVPHVGRTGYFVCCLCGHEWLADERHLWPEMWRLIRDTRPPVFFGEQVASKDGRVWLASVRASLEILGYAVGGADLCAAGVGAPHLRQRLWFVAYAGGGEFEKRGPQQGVGAAQRPGSVSIVGDTGRERLEIRSRERQDAGASEKAHSAVKLSSSVSRVAQPQCDRYNRPPNRDEPQPDSHESQDGVFDGSDKNLCGSLADTTQQFRNRGGDAGPGGRHESSDDSRNFWTPCEWLPCRDGKYRPTKLGVFPLAHGVSGRVSRLRAIGNAIVPEVAAEFIRAVIEPPAPLPANS